MMTSIVDELQIGVGNKNSGIKTGLGIFFIVLNTISMGLTFGNVQTSGQHGPKKSGGHLTNPATNIKFSFTLLDDIGFFETRFKGNFSQTFDKREFFPWSN